MANGIGSSRVIVVFSTKGGVGKTVVATNLAVCLAAEARAPVALLDLDVMAAGDAAKMLNLHPSVSVVDLEAHLGSPPGDGHPPAGFDLPSRLTAHATSVHVLPAVRLPSQVPSFSPTLIPPLFAALRQHYPYIIVDAGRALSDALLAVFDETNLILLVVTPDILSLSQAKWSLQVLDSLLIPSTMARVVVNRAESRGGVDTEAVRQALRCDVVAAIPSDGKTVGLAVNQGVPLLRHSVGSRVSQAFVQLAAQLARGPQLYMGRREVSPQAPRAAAPMMESPRLWARLPAVGHVDMTAVTPEREPDEVTQLKRRVHEQLVERMDLRKLDLSVLNTASGKGRELRQKTEGLIISLLTKEAGGLVTTREMRERLVKEIADEALGLGPLEEFLADPEISDILINNRDQIYIERHGWLELTPKRFVSDEQVRIIIERIVAPLGRRIDEANPMVDARLPDGSRVNAIIPPLSIKGPMLSIRKFARVNYTLDDLIRFGTLTPGMGEFLKRCVIGRKNLIISGGTGSGKTTLLNVISSFVPNTERIITIEDAAELRLMQEHWASLEARMANVEGKGAVTIRELFRNTLRMRPDRVIIGECRGGETLDMLQAMNTGHDGSMTTIHANSPQDVISRLDSMVLMSDIELPVRAIREMVVSAVHLICHTTRMSDGSRKVTSITEVVGLTEGLEVQFRDLFVFQQTGIDAQGRVEGSFVPTGELPTFFEEFRIKGVPLAAELFKAPAPSPR